MRKGMAQSAMYGGAAVVLASAFAEAGMAKTWAEVLTPEHVFAILGAVVMAAGALWHPAPKQGE